MDSSIQERDSETIERDIRALRIVSDGLARILFLTKPHTNQRPATDADIEVRRLVGFLEKAPRLIAAHMEDQSQPRWNYLIDHRTERAAQIMAERGPFDEPERTTKSLPFGWRSLTRIIKAPLLICSGVIAGYLASPIINGHDDFTGIEATYPNDTVTCTPRQMVASIPNPDTHGAVAVMFPCPDTRRPEIPALPPIPKTESR